MRCSLWFCNELKKQRKSLKGVKQNGNLFKDYFELSSEL